MAKLSVIVVKKELRLLLEAGVPYLLFRPLEGWMIGDMKVYDLSTGNLHDDEHIKDLKRDRVLHKEVTGPQDLGLVLQRASPGLGISRSRTLIDHVSPDGRASVTNTKFHFQLQGDAILPALGMIGGYPPDEVDILPGNGGSAWPVLGLPPPELAKLPLTPSKHSLWFHKDQLRFPIFPDLGEQRPEPPVPVSQHRLLRLALVNGELLSGRENPNPGRPVPPCESCQV